MAAQKEMDEAIIKLNTNLLSSIDELKHTIIENLRVSNLHLQLKVQDRKKEVQTLKSANIEIMKSTEALLQHARLEQVIVKKKGVPDEVESKKKDFELGTLDMMNGVANSKVGLRDVVA